MSARATARNKPVCDWTGARVGSLVVLGFAGVERTDDVVVRRVWRARCLRCGLVVVRDTQSLRRAERYGADARCHVNCRRPILLQEGG